MKKISTILFVLSLFTALTACQQESDQPSESSGAPAMPPLKSMSADFDQFTQANASDAGHSGILRSTSIQADVEANVSIQSASYFTFAAVQVSVWNTLLKIGLVVPVAAFVESHRHIPIRQPDGSWVRSFAVTVAGVLHTAQLVAKIDGNQVNWHMYVSKQGEFEQFNWFSGVAQRDGSSGYWILNDNPQNPNELLQIDWNWDAATQTGDVKYTNIEPQGTENGGYIHYGVDGADPYDAFYDIYHKSQGNLVEIEWNRTSHEGRVRNLNHFGNQDWHYWDRFLQDTVAPN